MWASYLGHAEVVKQLVVAGADVQACNRVRGERAGPKVHVSLSRRCFCAGWGHGADACI
jgi:hypothetical protein